LEGAERTAKEGGGKKGLRALRVSAAKKVEVEVIDLT
jgi:hypothetical protein